MAKETAMSEDAVVTRPNDGRFGDQFDDEVDIRAIVRITAGLAIISFVALVLMWALLRILEITEDRPRAQADAHPIVERMPAGPILQADPEGELAAMRREQAAVLHGYGWVDEAAGTVHIPIDTAMDLLLTELAAQPTPELPANASPEPEPETEEATDTLSEEAPISTDEEELLDADEAALVSEEEEEP